MKRVAQRYLISSIAFGVGALWFGVGLVSGFECLAAFVLTSLIVGVVQRRQAVARRRRAPRASATRRRERAHRVRDDEAEPLDWPLLADNGW